MKQRLALCGLAIAWCVMAVSFSQAQGQIKDQPLPALDKEFLLKDAVGNHAEIETGKLADSRSGTAAVKDLAAAIVKDHKAAYDKLAELLKGRKLAVVAGAEAEVRD